jgi:crotonobetainyl-CoA:carnitine CoA-transferase CaiB-like acyl-CoA transferase
MLENLKVVEFATMVAAPAAAGLLADWGADVIKIEPHRGDPMRGGGGPLGTTNFDIHNRGKRSIALSTSAPETREVILRLVRGADLFITNVLPGHLENLGLDYPQVAAANPRIVYGEISSYGREGPDRDRPATDNLGFWARGGGTGLLTPKGLDPLPIRQSVGDRITGLAACVGMLAALLEARMTGVGRLVDASLLRSAVWTFGTDVANQLTRGRVGTSKGRFEQVMPLSNYFRTQDGHWLQLHTSIQQLGPALGRPELASDPRWSNPAKARENGAELVTLVDEIFAGLTLAEARRLLEAGDVRWEPVQTMADLVADPQARITGCFVEVPDASSGRLQEQPASPPAFYGASGERLVERPGRPPVIGEHTEAVLREIGYDDADITRMRQNGTIPPAA